MIKLHFLIAIFFSFLLMAGCSNNRASNIYLVIDDIDRTHYCFPIERSANIKLNDLSFLNRLSPGIIVTKEKFELIDDTLVPFIRIYNNKRVPAIYGNLDMFYTMYLVKLKAGAFKFTSDEVDTVKFGLLNKTYNLPVRMSEIDSMIVEPLK